MEYFAYALEMMIWIGAWEVSSILIEMAREYYNKRKGHYYYEYKDENVTIKVQGKNKEIIEKMKKLID